MTEPMYSRDVEAEMELLGACAQRPQGIDEARTVGISDESFYWPKNAALWKAMTAILDEGGILDRGAIIDRALAMDSNLDPGDLRVHLATCVQMCPVTVNAPHYASRVAEFEEKRVLDMIGAEIQHSAGNGVPSAEILRYLRSQLDRLESRRPVRDFGLTGDYLLDTPVEVPSVWGYEDRVAWAAGEPTILYAPTGVGKTTLSHRLALARIGIGTGLVLALPVAPSQSRVLYVAADRPRQAERSIQRMIREEHRTILRERLVWWPKHLPFDVAQEPERLRRFARERDCDTVFLDGLKDVALDLVKDEVGTRLNYALQTCVADGIEVLANHHPRKTDAGAPDRPQTIQDLYGSNWIAAGAGSVIVLWGSAGDVLVNLGHLKQPAEPIVDGPTELRIDHHAGTVEIAKAPNLTAILSRHAATGITPGDAARLVYGTDKPAKNHIERVRTNLRRLEERGLATSVKTPGASVNEASVRYFPASGPTLEP